MLNVSTAIWVSQFTVLHNFKQVFLGAGWCLVSALPFPDWDYHCLQKSINVLHFCSKSVDRAQSSAKKRTRLLILRSSLWAGMWYIYMSKGLNILLIDQAYTDSSGFCSHAAVQIILSESFSLHTCTVYMIGCSDQQVGVPQLSAQTLHAHPLMMKFMSSRAS